MGVPRHIDGHMIGAKALDQLHLISRIAGLERKMPKDDARFLSGQGRIQERIVNLLRVNADKAVASNVPGPVPRPDLLLKDPGRIVVAWHSSPRDGGVFVEKSLVLEGLP